MGGHAWGSTDETELITAVHRALDLGINLFDTADIYGLGMSERILGSALRGEAQNAIVATKFGVRRKNGKTYYDNRPSWIRQALEESLQRLGLDRIDLYQVHYWDGSTPFEDIFGTLEILRQEGKISTYGVTNILPPEAIRKSFAVASFSEQFSLAHRTVEERIRHLLATTAMVFLSWGSLGQGVLSGKYGADVTFAKSDRRARNGYENFRGANLQHNLRVVSEMQRLASHREGRSLPQIALRWILDFVPRSIALVGIKRPQQIEEAAGSLGWILDAKARRALDRVSKEPGAKIAMPLKQAP